MMIFGPVPSSGHNNMTGDVMAIGFGVVGFMTLLLHIASRRGQDRRWPVILFFSFVFLFFIVGGFVELARLR